MSKKLNLHFPFVLGIFLIGLFSASVSEAGLSNSFTWVAGTSTNASLGTNGTPGTSITNYTISPTLAGYTNTNSVYGYFYNLSTNPAGTQVMSFSINGTNQQAYAYQLGLTNSTNSANNIVFTNLTSYRFDQGNVNLTNTTGGIGKTAGGLYIYNTLDSQVGGNVTFAGNMALYVGFMAGHSTARIVTQNTPSMCISNFGVNNQATAFTANVPLTWGGAGNTTINGVITNKAWVSTTTGTPTNNGYLLVNGGTFNIATTNTANTTANSGWNSGLVISNTGSVFVSGQNSLGSQAWDIKMGSATAGQTSTFGLFTTNEWATNANTSATITNNFVINNGLSGVTNRFVAGTGNTLTFSGNISSANTNGTMQFDAGTLVLNGANTGLSLPLVVTNNGTLVASNSSVMGSGGVTVASGATLQVNAGTLNSANYSGTGTLSLSGATSNSVGFTSTNGSKSVGPLNITNASLSLNVGAPITSSGSVNVGGAGSLITVSGSPSMGTSTLLSGASLNVAADKPIFLTGSAAGSPTSPIRLGTTFTNTNGSKFIFTNTATAFQVVMKAAGSDLVYQGGTGNWNTLSSNTNWFVDGTTPSAFSNGDSASFTGAGSLTVDAAGVTSALLSFSNPTNTAVNLSGGNITAASMSVTGQGVVTVQNTINVQSNSLSVSSGTLTVDGTINASNGVNVTGGTVAGSGSISAPSYSVANASYNLVLSGTNSLTVSGNSTLAGNNSGFTGPVTLNNNANLGNGSSLGTGVLNLSGGYVLGLVSGLGNNIALGVGGGGISNAGDVTLSGVLTNIAGQSSLTFSKSGQGVLNLSASVGADSAYVSPNVTQGILKLSGSQNYITNPVVATGATLLLNGGTLKSRGLTSSGSGQIEVTNTVTLDNSNANVAFANALLIDDNSQFISTSTNPVSFASVRGGGTLTVNGTATNTIGLAYIGVAGINIATNGVLSVSNSVFTNPYTKVTNGGSLRFDSSSAITNLYGNTVTAVTNNLSEISGSGLVWFSGSSSNYVINGAITGSQQLVMNSTGTLKLLLSSSNSFSGGIRYTTSGPNVNLQFSDRNALGTGDITNDGTTNMPIYMIATNSTWAISNNINTGPTNTGVVAFGPGTNNNTLILSGQVSGSGGLKITGANVAGAGQIQLDNTNNNYSGGTEIGNGTFVVAKAAALGTGPINFSTSNGNSILRFSDDTTLVQRITIGASVSTSTNNTAVFSVDSGKMARVSSSISANANYTNYVNQNMTINKTGAGTLSLALTNSYNGATALQQGGLTIENTCLGDTNSLSLTNGTTLNLAFSGASDTIGKLLINGVEQFQGTWGAPDSGAKYKSALISGTGTLNVTSGPSEVPVSVGFVLSSLNQSWDGTAKSVTPTTTPTATVSVTYNGSTNIPTEIGTYTVLATVTGPVNYTGSGTATLEITKATPSIGALPTVTVVTYGNSLGTSVLSGGTASGSAGIIPGQYVWNTPEAIPTNSGTVYYQVTFNPTDTVHYNSTVTTVSVTVAKASQTITNLAATASKNYGTADYILDVNRGLSTSTLSYSSSNTRVATINATTGLVHVVGAGTTTLTVNQAADANYNAASEVTQTLTVNNADQTIIFGSLAPVTYVGGATLSLDATASSGLNVSYESSDTTVATVSGSTVTIVGAGSAVITASQAGNSNYKAATAVPQTLTVTASAPTGLSYSSSSINGTIGAAIADLTPAVTGSGITYSIDPALPLGLLLNSTTGVISGTPSVTSASAIYTVTATNVGGSTTTGLTIEVLSPAFSLTITRVGVAQYSSPNTTVTHDFIGVPRQTYSVEYSTDLANWTSAGNQNTGETGSFSVTIDKPGNVVSDWNRHMFFRARLVR